MGDGRRVVIAAGRPDEKKGRLVENEILKGRVLHISPAISPPLTINSPPQTPDRSLKRKISAATVRPDNRFAVTPAASPQPPDLSEIFMVRIGA